MPVWAFKEQLTNSLKVTEKRGRNHFLVKLHVLHRFAFVAKLPEIIAVGFWLVAISAILVVATLQAFWFFLSFALVAHGSLASRTLLNESQAKVVELETHLKDQAWLGLISPYVIGPTNVQFCFTDLFYQVSQKGTCIRLHGRGTYFLLSTRTNPKKKMSSICKTWTLDWDWRYDAITETATLT